MRARRQTLLGAALLRGPTPEADLEVAGRRSLRTGLGRVDGYPYRPPEAEEQNTEGCPPEEALDQELEEQRGCH